MSIQDILRDEFDICEVMEIRNLSKNSPCYEIVTPHTGYVLKKADRLDFLKIYNKVQTILNDKGLIQGQLIPTKKNELMTAAGYSLTEYVAGEALETYSDEQFGAVLQYLYKYHQLLRDVPFAENEIEVINHWDKVRSFTFLCDKVEEIASDVRLDEKTKRLLRTAMKALSGDTGYLDRNRKQLIHSDLGPGNIVFSENQIQTVIDFTPEYENELYALSQLLYWTCLWDFSGSGSLNRIRSTLKVYFSNNVPQEYSEVGLFPYLLKACMVRFTGAVLHDLSNGVLNMAKVKKRITPLQTLFDIRHELS